MINELLTVLPLAIVLPESQVELTPVEEVIAHWTKLLPFTVLFIDVPL